MNVEQTEALIRRLGRMNDAVYKGRPAVLPEGSVSRLDLIERRLIRAVVRANTPGPERDGYPSGHRGGGSMYKFDDEGNVVIDHDAVDYHPDSSAQHAAFSLVLDKPKKDPVLEHTKLAYKHLEDAVNAIDKLSAQLDVIDAKYSTPPRHSNPGADCLSCDRHIEGTAEDRPRRGLCHTCYVAWRRAGKPDIMDFRRTRSEAA